MDDEDAASGDPNEWAHDAELLDMWRSGAPRATEQICARHLDAIITFVRVREPLDYEDLAQDTLVALIRGLSNIRDGRKTRAYALGCAENIIRRHRERRRVANEGVEALEDPNPVGSSLAAHRQKSRLFVRALKRMSHDEQYVYALHYIEGMSFVDIADHLELNCSTVRSRVQRANDKLKKTIAELAATGSMIDTTSGDLDDWVKRLAETV